MAISYARLAELRHRISLPVLKRVSGGIEGRHRSVFTGHGQDFEDMVAYHPGDDVSDIDWKASARAGEPVIRRFVKETNLSVVLAVDTSRAMRATAPSGQPKFEVAIDLVDIIAYLARIRGDQLALVYAEGSGPRQLPPRSGTEHLEVIRHRLRGAEPAPDDSMATILTRAESLIKRRSLVIVIGDDYSLDEACEASLKRLRIRHDVVYFSIPDVDLNQLTRSQQAIDVAAGPLPAFLAGALATEPQLAADVGAERARSKAQLADMMQRLAIRYARIGGSEDLEDALTDLFADRGRT